MYQQSQLAARHGQEFHAADLSRELGITQPTVKSWGIDRFIAAAGDEAHPQGILVCRTETERALPNGHIALPWQAFPQWLRARLAG